MTVRQNNSRSAPVNITAYFLERARHYRFADAMTKIPYEIERFCEIAFMFERMAHETRRSRLSSRFTAEIGRYQWSSILGRAAGIVTTWVVHSLQQVNDHLICVVDVVRRCLCQVLSPRGGQHEDQEAEKSVRVAARTFRKSRAPLPAGQAAKPVARNIGLRLYLPRVGGA